MSSAKTSAAINAVSAPIQITKRKEFTTAQRANVSARGNFMMMVSNFNANRVTFRARLAAEA